MLRAVVTIKHLTIIGLSTSVCLACGAADSTVGPPPLQTQLMEVRYASAVSAEHQGLIAAAAEKWTRALSRNRGDFPLNYPANHCFAGEPRLNEVHHNLLLFVSIGELDGGSGQLAFTEVCSVSEQDALPILAHIRLDQADLAWMETEKVLAGVITHEMGHALGFNPLSYMAKGLAAGGVTDPYFSGATARVEFAKHGDWYTGVRVPLEDSHDRGPNDPHWRFVIFGDELMASELGPKYRMPLSVITLGLFADLGYAVDFSVADSYEVIPLFGGNRLLPERSLAHDFRVQAVPTVVRPLVSR